MKFCGSCGKPLGCPNCGGENPYGMNFCGHCGRILVKAPVVKTDDGRTEVIVETKRISSAGLVAVSAAAAIVLVAIAVVIWLVTGA